MDKVLVSGTFALVTASEGHEFKKAEVRKVFKPKGLKLEKLSKQEYDKPVTGFRYSGKGGG
ncbi:MAG: hypothetical protein ACN4GG_03180 [Akkermansiaceae bacterium]|nr:hypothetical protein [Akkermansiaceae bacterium]